MRAYKTYHFRFDTKIKLNKLQILRFKTKIKLNNVSTSIHIYTYSEFICFSFFLFLGISFKIQIEKQPLPPGVTQKDVSLFSEVQTKAADTVTEIMNANGGHINLAVEQGGSNLSSCLLSSSTLAIVAQTRCPSAIEFGQWHIETWYSSPFPQEYARYVQQDIINLIHFKN